MCRNRALEDTHPSTHRQERLSGRRRLGQWGIVERSCDLWVCLEGSWLVSDRLDIALYYGMWRPVLSPAGSVFRDHTLYCGSGPARGIAQGRPRIDPHPPGGVTRLERPGGRCRSDSHTHTQTHTGVNTCAQQLLNTDKTTLFHRCGTWPEISQPDKHETLNLCGINVGSAS